MCCPEDRPRRRRRQRHGSLQPHAHRDTGGHESVIHEGGVQWMTAGSGLEHEEVSPHEFLERGGPLEILQLWINLPSRLKMTTPAYTGLQNSQIPSFTLDGERVRVNLIAGSWEDRRGPIESLTGVHMTTIELRPGGAVELPVPAGRNVFLYVVREEIRIGGHPAPQFHLAELQDDGDSISVESGDDSLILFGHVAPIGEPVVAHGPFVMNTREEILEAIRDYQAGKFRGAIEL
ncbi:MAG TPA: pirin-like C-terminal cupin domain-containing protein [Thermoanaerobaculia bacterium]|nr:pirin-like C-terminal cupin domain-containing protein [Thermoanaerobaculia bacterium]